MIIWFFFSVIALLLAFFSQKKYFPKEYEWVQFVLSVWLAWFVSFGSREMQDQPNYVLAYKSFENFPLYNLWELLLIHIDSLLGTRDGMEIGFQTVCSIFNKCGFSYIGFAFFYAIFLNNLIIKFIYRYNYPLISVLIFIATIYYSQQANLLRQMMAVALFLYATKFILSKQFKFYFLFILSASFFHASAILLLPVYFFILNNHFFRILLFLWIFSIALNYVGENTPIIQAIRLINVDYYDIELNKYEGVGERSSFNWLYNIIVLIIFLSHIEKRKNIRTQIILYNLFILGVIILNLRIASDWFYRLSLYFTIFYIILLPSILKDLKETNLNYILNKNLLNKTFLIPIVYYLYILYSNIFRDIGLKFGHDMYTFIDMWK